MIGGVFLPLFIIGEFMKDIKVMFKGNKFPSGYAVDKEFMVGKKYLENLQADGRYDIEVMETPKEAPKPKKKKTSKK
tara:strand:- start:9 stop:239 length:231 start_codon:yes stop_codon:yes gene_type:complete